MPRDKQRTRALAIAAPEGSAGAILADFTGEEAAAMLAHASRRTREARRRARQGGPGESLRRARGDAYGEGRRAVGGGRGLNKHRRGLSEAEQFALSSPPPQRLSRAWIRPPRSARCASALTPSQRRTFSKSSIPTLPPPRWRDVRRGGAAGARGVRHAIRGGGNPASDTPLVAAMVPYMASLMAPGGDDRGDPRTWPSA